MTFVYIVFAWLILMIAWNIYKGKKEKEIILVKGGCRNILMGAIDGKGKF